MKQLATLLTSLDDVPDAVREYYSPVDANDASAGFQLGLDKAQNKTEISAFRAENLNLRKQVESFDKKLSDLGGLQAKFDLLQKAAGSKEDAENIEAGNIDAVVERRVKAALLSGDQKYSALETSFATVQKERNSLVQRVGTTRIRDEMVGAFRTGKARMKDGAETDLMARASGTWSVDPETDRLVAKNSQTGEPLYGDEGKPMQMAEWAAGQATSAAYLFESGQGSGSSGNKGDSTRRKAAGDGKSVDVNDGMSLARNLDDVIARKVRPTMS
jgi:hypothetical protein